MIRVAAEADVPAMLAIYSPYVSNTTVSFEYEVPTTAEFLNRFRGITSRFPWLVWEEEGRVLGYAYAAAPFERRAFGWCAEPSIYLAPCARRRGIGRRLYAALELLLKEMGFQVLYAWITGENTGSVAFHKAMGYSSLAVLERSGYKSGRWCDLVWMEKRLDSVENPMDFPVKWDAFVQDEQKICDILYNLSLS